jgi:chromosome segregation and condensation protein ScpB
MSAATTRRVQKSKKSGQAAIQAQAVKAVIQILFATSRSYTIDTLREKLREFYLEEADYEKRALASLSAVEVVTALLEASPTLAAIGLQVKIINGTVQLATCRLENRNLAAFIGARSEHTSELTHPALEVLACVAFKQPVSQSEIDRMFGNVDKRHLVFVLREAEMIEEFAGEDGRLRFATTGKFLRHFGLANVGELKAALQEAEAHEASAQQSTMGFL